MTGADARQYLQGQITQDVRILSSTQAIFAALLTPHGKTISELYVIDASNNHDHIATLYLLVPSHKQDAVIQRLQRFVLRDDVSIQPAADMCLYTLQCADSNKYAHLLSNLILMPLITTKTLLDAKRYSCVWQDEICLMRQAECCATGLWLLSNKGNKDIIFSNNNNYNNYNYNKDNKLAFWDRARIIYGTPRFGVDWDEQDIPLNAGLSERGGVSFAKGCYVGQEIISRMHCRDGIRKCLLHMRASQQISVGQEVCTTSKIGLLTSVAYDAQQQCWFAIARLPLACVQSSLFTADGISLTIIKQAG